MLGDWCLKFRDSVALPPARVEISNEGHSPGDISTIEDETVMLSRDVGHGPVTYTIYQKNEEVGCIAMTA
jgi:hypothetical protein